MSDLDFGNALIYVALFLLLVGGESIIKFFKKMAEEFNSDNSHHGTARTQTNRTRKHHVSRSAPVRDGDETLKPDLVKMKNDKNDDTGISEPSSPDGAGKDILKTFKSDRKGLVSAIIVSEILKPPRSREINRKR